MPATGAESVAATTSTDAVASGGSAEKPSASEPGNDEVLFIVSHQVAELWFKLILRELESVRSLFRMNPVPDDALAAAVRSLRRAATIFEVATDHWRVVETLTTRDYLAFRDQLVGASGFQSAQLRQIEILLGLDDTKRITCAGERGYKDALRTPTGGGSPALARVEGQLASGPSLRDALDGWLARTPIDGSSEPGHVEDYVARFLAAHEKQAHALLAVSRAQAHPTMDLAVLEERYQKDIDKARAFLHCDDLRELEPRERQARRHSRAALVFIESHRELPRLAWPREVVEATLALEQSMIIWRQRHARMVERVIGRRPGTGGSGGVDYLDATALNYRVFGDLWAVRTILLKSELVPSLAHAADYRFRVED
ncbi:MAG: tryptophan 2,3-dioxygenase [Myxococcales bacterium]|nr:tryptophan 2,3-dioxygenase [Myxococcales bacterium]